jgi:hypothetical protein
MAEAYPVSLGRRVVDAYEWGEGSYATIRPSLVHEQTERCEASSKDEQQAVD